MLDRQERLKGDLNALQRFGLFWLMNEENQEKVDLEKYRALQNALGANQATSPEFIKHLLGEMEEEVVYVTEDEWKTPESVDEIEQMFRTYG